MKEVRLIDEKGEQMGVVNSKRALEIARERKLDLVNVAPKARPPVCKIIDYGKYKYELTKKEKEAKKKQRIINVKEVRLSPRIDDHDLEVKANQARKFLQAGDRVKVSVRFRGRELGHTDIGRRVMEQFSQMVADCSIIDKRPAMEGRSMVMFLNPAKEEPGKEDEGGK